MRHALGSNGATSPLWSDWTGQGGLRTQDERWGLACGTKRSHSRVPSSSHTCAWAGAGRVALVRRPPAGATAGVGPTWGHAAGAVRHRALSWGTACDPPLAAAAMAFRAGAMTPGASEDPNPGPRPPHLCSRVGSLLPGPPGRAQRQGPPPCGVPKAPPPAPRGVQSQHEPLRRGACNPALRCPAHKTLRPRRRPPGAAVGKSVTPARRPHRPQSSWSGPHRGAWRPRVRGPRSPRSGPCSGSQTQSCSRTGLRVPSVTF